MAATIAVAVLGPTPLIVAMRWQRSGDDYDWLNLFWQLIAPTEPSVYVRSFAAGHVEIVHAQLATFLPSCEASAGNTAKSSDTSRASSDASAEFVRKAPRANPRLQRSRADAIVMMRGHAKRQTIRQIFAGPIIVVVLSAAGLFGALDDDIRHGDFRSPDIDAGSDLQWYPAIVTEMQRL